MSQEDMNKVSGEEGEKQNKERVPFSNWTVEVLKFNKKADFEGFDFHSVGDYSDWDGFVLKGSARGHEIEIFIEDTPGGWIAYGKINGVDLKDGDAKMLVQKAVGLGELDKNLTEEQQKIWGAYKSEEYQ